MWRRQQAASTPPSATAAAPTFRLLLTLTAPGGLPGFWVVARDAQADLLPNFKPPVWLEGQQTRLGGGQKGSEVRLTVRRSATAAYCQQDDAGGLHGVLWGKHDPAVVHPTVKLRVWGPTHREVPFKEVVLQQTEGRDENI